MRKIAALLAVFAVVAATGIASSDAFAAKPKLGTRWTGGGNGAPMGFALDKKGRATAAFTGYACAGRDGQGSASTNNPSGKVGANGRITITFRAKKVNFTIKVRFPTRTTARGTVSFKGANCKADSFAFTARVGVEG